jgi:hypothetical protein
VFFASILILVILVVVPELCNTGKTIVEPFTTNLANPDNSHDEKSEDSGEVDHDSGLKSITIPA